MRQPLPFYKEPESKASRGTVLMLNYVKNGIIMKRAEESISLFHCATRLCFKVKDSAAVNKENLSRLSGVIKVLESGGQIQVVIGNNVADGLFTFLPVFLAYTAAKKFKANEFVAVAIAAAGKVSQGDSLMVCISK